jgi:hypothetical protein
MHIITTTPTRISSRIYTYTYIHIIIHHQQQQHQHEYEFTYGGGGGAVLPEPIVDEGHVFGAARAALPEVVGPGGPVQDDAWGRGVVFWGGGSEEGGVVVGGVLGGGTTTELKLSV